MPPIIDSLKRIFDHYFPVDPFSFLSPSVPSPDDLAKAKIQEVLELQDKLLQMAKTSRRETIFEKWDRLIESIQKNPLSTIGLMGPALLPFYVIGKELDLPRKVENFIENSGIVEGLRQFWAATEKAHERKLECLKSDDNKSTKSLTEETIKNYITSKNSSFFSMEDVSVRLENGKIYISGLADFPGPNFKLDLVIQLNAKNGKVEGKVERFDLDGDPIGETLLGIIMDRIRASGFYVPKKPDLKDLSWLEIDKLFSLEVKEGEILMEYSSC